MPLDNLLDGEIEVQIHLRGDTAAGWLAKDPVLGLYELGFESDTRLLKAGDGTTEWSSLAYLTQESKVRKVEIQNFIGNNVFGLTFKPETLHRLRVYNDTTGNERFNPIILPSQYTVAEKMITVLTQLRAGDVLEFDYEYTFGQVAQTGYLKLGDGSLFALPDGSLFRLY